MGILINTGFDVGSSNPIDSRTLKETTLERDALISDGLVYENLKVYCKDTQTEYRWTWTEWEEVGTGGSGSGTDISMTDYYTKTEVNNDFLKKVDADSKYATITTVEKKIDKDKIVTVLDDTVTDEQVTSALLTKTELDKKASKTYLGRYVFESGTVSRLLYIGKIYSIGNQQGFTSIEVKGGRVDGNFGHGYIHINLIGHVVANLEHPISNMTFFVTKEGNEARLYCNMDTYCTLVVDVANGSKCDVIGEFVDSSLGTISWNNAWRELATMDKVADILNSDLTGINTKLTQI